MVFGRQRTEWERTAIVLSMLEGCRQVEGKLDGIKFMPDLFKEQQPGEPPSKEQIESFRKAMAFGASVRR